MRELRPTWTCLADAPKREVIPNQLWIGNVIDARTPVRLHEIGIVAVVDLAVNESPAQLSREMVYCRFPIVDGGGNDPAVLRAAVETTASLIRDKVPTLVSCSAGAIWYRASRNALQL